MIWQEAFLLLVVGAKSSTGGMAGGVCSCRNGALGLPLQADGEVLKAHLSNASTSAAKGRMPYSLPAFA